MENLRRWGEQMYRLWIAKRDGKRPTCWNHLPAETVALEPVENALYTATEAALFVSGFNASILESNMPIWAVAVPVTIRLEGDAQCGLPVEGYRFPAHVDEPQQPAPT